MQIFHTYAELLDRIRQANHRTRVLGHAPDGSPLIAVRSGGQKEPAVLITAGAHATEHAGVSAAVQLLESLRTEHIVYVLPTRDPVGLGGFAHALSLGLGETPEFQTFDAVESILRETGDVLFDEDGMVLALIGEYGYGSCRPGPDRTHAQRALHKKLVGLQRTRPAILEPLRGRRIYLTPGQSGVEGTGTFGRAYTLVVAPDGEVLHLNRFHDTAWAPVEPRCARKLLDEIRPGLSFDLHESQIMEDRFWLSARKQQTAENQQWEERIAREIIGTIAATGAGLASDDDVTEGVPLKQTSFQCSEKGVYWLDAGIRGEGLNLSDYVARHHGLVFGTEMGMFGSFETRVNLALVVVQTAVRIFEQRYR